ncbi:MAG TPA: phosphotransferase [Acidimicrobiia bacterium]|nr:phosphotransferase [Acidimicrobiia bacterium]
MIDQPELPGGRALLTSEALELLSVAADPFVIESLRCHQAVARLGETLTVSYECLISDRNGNHQQRLLVARAGRKLPAGAVVLSDGSVEVAVWKYPEDPYLPGLALGLDNRLTKMLSELGLPYPADRVEVRSYLPGRRAVIEVFCGDTRIFIKAVRPHTVEKLRVLHNSIVGQVTIPTALAWFDEDGLIFFEAMPGETLWEHLSRGGLGPDPDELIALLDCLPPLAGGPPRLLEQAPSHARLLSFIAADRSQELARTIGALEQTPKEPAVPVHGDLHSGQIILEEGMIHGLLDVDRAGNGTRADDLAGLLAHLDSQEAGADYRNRLWNRFVRLVDRDSLRLRTAAALLGFAPTPFVSQQPDWPDEVRRRIDSAARLARI